MRSLQYIVEKIGNVLNVVAVLIIVIGIAITFAELVSRNAFNSSLFIVNEYTGYLVAVTMALSLSKTISDRKAIRIAVIDQILNKNLLGAVYKRLMSSIALLFFVFAIYFFSISVMRSYERGYVSPTFSQTPLWIPELLFVVGLVGAALAIAVSGVFSRK